MPLLQPNTDLELQKTGAAPMPQAADPDGPSALEVAAAAERTSNLAGTLYDSITNAAPNPTVKPGFDPLVSIPKGYEAQASLFADVRSPIDMELRRQQIDRENADKQTIARAGGWGLAATMAAGLTDPLTLASMVIPVGAPTRLAQAGKFAAGRGTDHRRAGARHAAASGHAHAAGVGVECRCVCDLGAASSAPLSGRTSQSLSSAQ